MMSMNIRGWKHAVYYNIAQNISNVFSSDSFLRFISAQAYDLKIPLKSALYIAH